MVIMENKKEVVNVTKDGKETSIEILNCFELGNGKTYVLYSYDGEEDVYASSLVETKDELILDDITDEEIQLIMEVFNEGKEEV